MKHPSVDRINELLCYNPDTGDISWRIKRGKCAAGRIVTCKNEKGYIVVRVDNVLLRAHRIGWAVTHNAWPEKEIDHINGIRFDNRISNLREANHSQNMKNIKKSVANKSGKKGVSWHKQAQKWQVHIKVDGVNHYLGLFDSVDDAHEKYKQVANDLHGMFSRHQ
jgi:hypothetical protein